MGMLGKHVREKLAVVYWHVINLVGENGLVLRVNLISHGFSQGHSVNRLGQVHTTEHRERQTPGI